MPPRITISQIPVFADRYDYRNEDDDLLSRQPRIKRERKMRKADLRALAQWKSPRSAHHIEKNTPREVEEITAIALRTKNERIRIEALQLLYGVNYPTASVILHFFHGVTYPILDFRALWAMRFPQPAQYTFDFWWTYVQACRRFSERSAPGSRP